MLELIILFITVEYSKYTHKTENNTEVPPPPVSNKC